MRRPHPRFILSFTAAAALTACSDSPPDSSRPLGDYAPIEASTAPDQTTVIRNVRVFDGEAVLEGQTVVLANGLIEHVAALPWTGVADVEVDGTGKTLVPGLIDAEMHLTADNEEEALRELRQALSLGVTTVFDVGSYHGQASVVRRSGADPKMPVASIVSAQAPATEGNLHMKAFGIRLPWIDHPAQAPEWVRRRTEEGAEWISIYRGSTVPRGQIPGTSAEVMVAVAEAAQAQKRPTVLHAVSPLNEGEILAALDAGVDGFAHVFSDGPLSPDVLVRVRESRVFVIPALTFDGYLLGMGPQLDPLVCDEATRPFLSTQDAPGPFELVRKHRTLMATAADADAFTRRVAFVRSLVEAGVTVLAGSDAPFVSGFQGAQLHVELGLLQHAGMSAQQALAAATSRPADALGMSDRGRIAKGLRADAVLVDGDPTQNLDVLRRIDAVWKAGVRLNRERLREQLASPGCAYAESAGSEH